MCAATINKLRENGVGGAKADAYFGYFGKPRQFRQFRLFRLLHMLRVCSTLLAFRSCSVPSHEQNKKSEHLDEQSHGKTPETAS